jgi:hypothetical protein
MHCKFLLEKKSTTQVPTDPGHPWKSTFCLVTCVHQMLQLIVQSNIPAGHGHMGVITFTTQSAYMSACTNQLFSLTWRYTCYSILPIHNEQWAAWNAWMHPVSATHPILQRFAGSGLLFCKMHASNHFPCLCACSLAITAVSVSVNGRNGRDRTVCPIGDALRCWP